VGNEPFNDTPERLFDFVLVSHPQVPKKLHLIILSPSALVGCLWQIFLLLVAGKEEETAKHNSSEKLSAKRNLACVGSRVSHCDGEEGFKSLLHGAVLLGTMGGIVSFLIELLELFLHSAFLFLQLLGFQSTLTIGFTVELQCVVTRGGISVGDNPADRVDASIVGCNGQEGNNRGSFILVHNRAAQLSIPQALLLASKLEFNNKGSIFVGRLADGVGVGLNSDVTTNGDIELDGLSLASFLVEGKVIAIGILSRDDQRTRSLDGIGVDGPVDDKLLTSLSGRLNGRGERSSPVLILVLQGEVDVGLGVISLGNVLTTDDILDAESEADVVAIVEVVGAWLVLDFNHVELTINGVIENRGILIEFTIEGIVVGRGNVFLGSGHIAERNNVGAEGIKARGDGDFEEVLAVGGTSLRNTSNSSKKSARRAGDIHEEMAVLSSTLAIDVGGGVTINVTQVRESGGLNRNLDSLTNLEGRGIIRLEAFEGDGSSDHRERKLVINSLSAVHTTGIGHFETEGQMTSREVRTLQHIGEGKRGSVGPAINSSGINSNSGGIQNTEDDTEVTRNKALVGVVLESQTKSEFSANGNSFTFLEFLASNVEVGLWVNYQAIADLLGVG